jgi:hypothetical protein
MIVSLWVNQHSRRLPGASPQLAVSSSLAGLAAFSSSPIRFNSVWPLHTVRAFPGLERVLCPRLIPALRHMQLRSCTGLLAETTAQVSRGKHTLFPYTTAGFTLPVLDGYGLRYLTLTRPTLAPSYPVPVRRLVPLIHASFRPHLTMTPLRFSTLHLHQVARGTFTLPDSVHARHTSG